MSPRRQTVVFTSGLPAIASAILSPEFDIVTHPWEQNRTEQDLITILSEADGAITLLTDPLTRAVLESNPHLRVVANFAVGYDNIDLAAARELGIVVTNTPGVLTDATADLTIALILAVTRRLIEGDRIMRSGEFPGWQPLYLLGSSLRGKRLGVIGMGRIGSAVAERARAFGMEVVSTSRSHGFPLDELLRTSDVVSIHCPYTNETRHLIDRSALSKMKKEAYLVNTARGAIVDEEALAEALEEGRIRGAGLDVYENEPEVHPRLLDLPNVVLLPHLGSNTEEARTAMARIAATNVAAVLNGKPAVHPV